MLFNWLTVAAAAQTESLTRTHIRTPIIGQFHFDSLVCVWDLHRLGWTRNYDSLLWRTLRARSSTSSTPSALDSGTTCGFVKLAHRLLSTPGQA